MPSGALRNNSPSYYVQSSSSGLSESYRLLYTVVWLLIFDRIFVGDAYPPFWLSDRIDSAADLRLMFGNLKASCIIIGDEERPSFCSSALWSFPSFPWAKLGLKPQTLIFFKILVGELYLRYSDRSAPDSSYMSWSSNCS